MTARSSWIVTRRPVAEPEFRLLCVPNAGAGVLTYRAWPDAFPDAEVAIAHLPGRDGRAEEPCSRTIQESARGLSDALDDLSPLPLVIFGHSMGALIAFEIAHERQKAGQPPAALIVSGRRAPSRPPRFAPIADLPLVEFGRAAAERYGGIPPAVLEDEELAEMFLPVLRADLQACDAYRHDDTGPLRCPLVVYGGTQDPHTTREDLEAWRAETTGLRVLRGFAGGHFYVDGLRAAVTDAIRTDLERLGVLVRRPLETLA